MIRFYFSSSAVFVSSTVGDDNCVVRLLVLFWKGILKSNAKGVIILYFIIIIIFSFFSSLLAAFRVVTCSCCCDPVQILHYGSVFITLLPALTHFPISHSSRYYKPHIRHVTFSFIPHVTCFTDFLSLLFSIGLITARLNCREKLADLFYINVIFF